MLLALPTVWWGTVTLVWAPLERAFSPFGQRPLWLTAYGAGLGLIIYGLTFAALWLSTKRALARAAE